MEASLIDMTRGLERYVPAFSLDVEIEVVRPDEDADYDLVVDFADPWFAVHEDALAAEELPVTPIATRQSLHAVLGIAVAVLVATSLYAATL